MAIRATPIAHPPAHGADVVVDLSPQPTGAPDGARITEQADGGVLVDLNPNAPTAPITAAFDANLADTLDSSLLARLAAHVIEGADADEEARKPWFERFQQGLALMGVEGAAAVASPFYQGEQIMVHPLIAEAVLQFQARAIDALFPPDGPVRADILGARSPEVIDQARRVEDFMNYQCLTQDRGYYGDTDQMLFVLPIAGSVFRKSYYDTLRKKVITRHVRANDLLAPYDAGDIESASRITHRFRKPLVWVRRMQKAGVYRDVPIAAPGSTLSTDAEDVARRVDDTQPSEIDGDAQPLLYECCLTYDLGEDPDGLPLPYIVTVEKEQEQVLAVRRNWEPDDPDRNVRVWYAHYKFLPGMGFYGWGFLHAIGGLGEAATETLRALINAAHFASMQGGFRSNDVNIPAGELAFRPGEYKGVNATTDDLKKAFFIPPFKEPSPALFQCLNLIVESGRRYAGTMEVVLGDAATSAPVGTTLALIEQSGKLFSGIHKRLHAAMSEEFRQRAALNGTYLPDSYPYAVRGAQNGVFRADFDERLDIIPVSDPNITTQAQRIVLAQTIKQLAEEAPDLYDRRAVHMRMHEAIRTPSIEEIMPPPEQVQPMDPVTEGQRIMQQQPVQAFPEQNHDAHLVVHQALMAQVQAMPSVQQVMPALLAHMAEHFALRYRVAIEQAIGMPLVNVPPEAQEQVAMLAAQAIQRVQAAAALASAATQAAQAQAGAPANGQARPGYTQ